MRKALSLLLALWWTGAAAEQAGAGHCFVFWASQCFEIHDARSRDITHHVMITRGPISYPAAADCDAALEDLLSVDQRADLLDDFNDVLEDVDGCGTLDKAPARTFSSSEEALTAYRRLTREGSHTRRHRIDPPRLERRD